MAELHDYLVVKENAKANAQNSIIYKNIRCSLITSRLLRIEKSSSEEFTDEPTQSIFHRDLGKVDFDYKETGKCLQITTKDAIFNVSKNSGKLLYVIIDGKKIKPNPNKNLKGTARTLDVSYGAVPLGNGVISKDGVAIFDDSKSLIIAKDGMVEKRKVAEKDKYIFAYGTDYIGALHDFYLVCGVVPLIPRYAFGNWWSRYKAYTQDEYKKVIDDFKHHDIPLTVATIDMDWHWVNLKDKFGKDATANELGGSNGWTGYSWNTDLFPNHRALLDYLHNENLKVTLNLHPADGIRHYEDCYRDVAKAMGKNPDDKKPIKFDVANKDFINAYFDYAHHPLENEGVDFWWIDWQQGTKSTMDGLDPLWSLNHYHYLDNQRSDRRGLILSRYCGIGAHRYPLGFSGDTAMYWSVLKFQPYFTSTASNCGYTWWSHDIGGHMAGLHSDEMYIRWVQLGVFSPILRLHSTQNDLAGKEPWSYSYEAESVVTDFMRLRHRLIPYIYAMNERTHNGFRALCEPLYYEHPNEKEAYRFKNAFYFGSELLVTPVTSRMSRKTNTALTRTYLPKGRWTNVFNNRQYDGGKVVRINSEIDEMPVFIKEGGIVPLSLDKTNRVDNPKKLELLMSHGTNEFSLYEDDGETNAYKNGEFSRTNIAISESGSDVKISISGAKKFDFMPEKRDYTLSFVDVISAENISVLVNGQNAEYSTVSTDDRFKIVVENVDIEAEVQIELNGAEYRQNNDYREEVMRIFTKLGGGNLLKMAMYKPFAKAKSKEKALSLAKRIGNLSLKNELLEVLEDMKY